MQNEEINVSLKGAGLNFDYKTSLPKAAQVIAFLSMGEELHQEKPSSVALPLSISSSNTPRAAVSPLEAVRQSGARTYPQKIATLGLFIVRRDNRETFDPKEILTLLRRMGDMPKNYTRDLQNAELLGYVTREPNNEYLLTEHGAQSVDAQFSEASSLGSGQKKKRTKKKSDGTDLDSNPS